MWVEVEEEDRETLNRENKIVGDRNGGFRTSGAFESFPLVCESLIQTWRGWIQVRRLMSVWYDGRWKAWSRKYLIDILKGMVSISRAIVKVLARYHSIWIKWTGISSYWGREKILRKWYLGWSRRLLMKSFPDYWRRVICWALALSMAFCFEFLLIMTERAPLGWARDVVGDDSELCWWWGIKSWGHCIDDWNEWDDLVDVLWLFWLAIYRSG